jgi:hypothetical protein
MPGRRDAAKGPCRLQSIPRPRQNKRPDSAWQDPELLILSTFLGSLGFRLEVRADEGRATPAISPRLDAKPAAAHGEERACSSMRRAQGRACSSMHLPEDLV